MNISRFSRWSAPLIVVAASGLWGASASAAVSAADPVTVAVSDLLSAGGKVTGTLTMRSKSAVRVDPATVKAKIDGVPTPASITQAAAPTRRAMLVIDTSGSMGRAGMATVRQATAAYLRAVPADVKVGVVSFANTAGVDLAPTIDRAAVQRVVNGLASRGDTALYAAMQSALTPLGKTGDRSIVLLSDGADTVADDQAAALKSATTALRSQAIRVDVVRFRSTDPAAGVALKSFADANGGSVTAADDAKAVTSEFEASAKALESQVQFEIQPGTRLAGQHDVLLEGTVNGQKFSIAKRLDFTPLSQPAPSATNVPVAAPGSGAGAVLPVARLSAPPSWWPIAAAALLALGLFGIAAASFAPTLQTQRERRVESIEQYVVGPRIVSRSENKPAASPFTEQLSSFGERAMEGQRFSSWVAQRIETADLPFRVGDWFLLSVSSGVVGGVLGFVVARRVPLSGVALGFVAGVLIAQLVLSHLASRRARQFEAVLPDVLMLVATSLRSGFGLPQALDAVARDASEPAAKEFSRALAETRIGTDVADALDHAASRMRSKALRWTIMAIRIQRDVGGNLADTLLTTSATLRERESLKRQVRSLSAEGRLSAWILIIVPIFLFAYMAWVNFEYVSLLWTHPIGLLMTILSVLLMVLGVFWMSKLVKVEV